MSSVLTLEISFMTFTLLESTKTNQKIDGKKNIVVSLRIDFKFISCLQYLTIILTDLQMYNNVLMLLHQVCFQD